MMLADQGAVQGNLVAGLCEIVPCLEESVVSELLRRHDNDFERALDAALALAASLSEEQGTLVITPLRSESSSDSVYSNQGRSVPESKEHNAEPTSEPVIGEAKIIRVTSNDRRKSTSSISPVGRNRSASGASQRLSLEHQTFPRKRSGEHFAPDTLISSRGTAMVLPRSFLTVPNFRVLSRYETMDDLTFAVRYNRKQLKLGLTIKEIGAFIVVTSLQSQATGPNERTRSLAELSGVLVGDIVVGINGEDFSPWAEFQDVLDMLSLSGHFVTLHFLRAKTPVKRGIPQSDSLQQTSSHEPTTPGTQLDKYPRRMRLFVEHKVATIDDLPTLDRTVQYLKTRVVKWSSTMLAEKISAWKLDPLLSRNTNSVDNSDDSGDEGDGWKDPSGQRTESNASATTPQASTGWFPLLTQLHRRMSMDGGDSGKEQEVSDSPKPTPSRVINRRHTIDAGSSSNGRSPVVNSAGGSRLPSTPDFEPYTRKYSDIETQNLRPAFSVRLLRSELVAGGGHVVYVIWVLDVKSGVEWCIRRRFREFEVFRETVVSIRSRLSQLSFPNKHLSAVTEKKLLVQERLAMLQKFLRRIAGIITLNSHHPSTIQLHVALQRFLAVGDHLDRIVMRESDHTTHLARTIEVFVHNVLHLPLLDRALQQFVETYMGKAVEDVNKQWSENDGGQVLEELKNFLDLWQDFLSDCLVEDCIDILSSVLQEGGADLMPGQTAQLIEMLTSSVISHSINSKSLSVSRETSSASATAAGALPLSTASGTMLSTQSQQQAAAEMEIKRQRFDEQRRQREVEDRCQSLIELTTDEFRTLIRNAIRRQVEIEIYLATLGRVDFIMQAVYLQDDAWFADRASALMSLPQTYYDIPVEHISPSSWQAAVNTFKDVARVTLPCDKIDRLLEVSKSIITVYREEHLDSSTALGADDLLPIFIYVIVQACLPNMISLSQTLQCLCAEDKRMSEAGYYLATLHASITHILRADLNNERPFAASRLEG